MKLNATEKSLIADLKAGRSCPLMMMTTKGLFAAQNLVRRGLCRFTGKKLVLA